PMDLIKIDPVDLEPAQTIFTFAPNGIDLQSPMHISLFVPEKTAFGEKVRPWSRPSFDRGGYNFFGVTYTVYSRGIDPVDTQFQCPMDRCNGSFVALFPPAEFPAGTADSPG